MRCAEFTVRSQNDRAVNHLASIWSTNTQLRWPAGQGRAWLSRWLSGDGDKQLWDSIPMNASVEGKYRAWGQRLSVRQAQQSNLSALSVPLSGIIRACQVWMRCVRDA
jgi:hypothetical protein